MSPKLPKGYLDTCLVSGMAERDLPPVELKALQEVLQARKAGRIALVTSHVTRQELERMSDDKRQRHAVIYMLLADVPTASEGYSSAPLGAAPLGATVLGGGPGYEDPVLAELKRILPDVDDARHLLQAIKNEVDYFITADQRTIVSRASVIESHYAIKVRLPSQVLPDLT
jgi:predicted nucleic acid-binding protein